MTTHEAALLLLILSAASLWYSSYANRHWHNADCHLFRLIGLTSMVTAVQLLWAEESSPYMLNSLGVSVAGVVTMKVAFGLRRKNPRLRQLAYDLLCVQTSCQRLFRALGNYHFYRRVGREFAPVALFLGGVFYLDLAIGIFVAGYLWLGVLLFAGFALAGGKALCRWWKMQHKP